MAYVAVVGGQIVAYAAVIDGKDEAYDKFMMANGSTTTIVISPSIVQLSCEILRVNGIAQTFLQGLIEGQAGSDFRIDTHKKNKAMRHIVEKLGFVYCGKVPIDGERLAYQKSNRIMRMLSIKKLMKQIIMAFKFQLSAASRALKQGRKRDLRLIRF